MNDQMSVEDGLLIIFTTCITLKVLSVMDAEMIPVMFCVMFLNVQYRPHLVNYIVYYIDLPTGQGTSAGGREEMDTNLFVRTWGHDDLSLMSVNINTTGSICLFFYPNSYIFHENLLIGYTLNWKLEFADANCIPIYHLLQKQMNFFFLA